MFRYRIALPVSPDPPIIEVDDNHDLPLHKQITVVLGHDVDANFGGGHMHLSAGSQISGIIVGKQALPPSSPPAANPNP